MGIAKMGKIIKPVHVSQEDWDFFQSNKDKWSQLGFGDKRKMFNIFRFGHSTNATDVEWIRWVFANPIYLPSNWPPFGLPVMLTTLN